MTQYVLLDPTNTFVAEWFLSPQPQNAAVVALADTDARFVAWQAAQALPGKLAALLGGGLTITSTSTPSLNGTYPCDQGSIDAITEVAAGDAEGEGLPGGAATVSFPDLAGVLHSFDETQFKAWATAVRNFVGEAKQALLVARTGGTPSWPADTATIP